MLVYVYCCCFCRPLFVAKARGGTKGWRKYWPVIDDAISAPANYPRSQVFLGKRLATGLCNKGCVQETLPHGVTFSKYRYAANPLFCCWPFRVIMCAVGGGGGGGGGGVAFSILAIGRWSSSMAKRYKEGSFLPFQSLLLSPPPLSFDPLRILLLPLLRPRSHRKWEERTLSLHFSFSFLRHLSPPSLAHRPRH